MNQVNKELQRAMKLKQVGASFFDTTGTVKYGQHRLEIWPGITSTIRSREYHPLICIEPTHKVVRYNINYLNLVCVYINISNRGVVWMIFLNKLL